MFFASRISAKSDFTTAAIPETFTIEDGNPIRVMGITLTNKNSTANTVTILMKNGTTTIGSYEILQSISFNMEIPFLADAGLSFELTAESGVGGSTNISIIVFHTASGA